MLLTAPAVQPQYAACWLRWRKWRAMQSWFFSFVLRARAHCNPSCLCLAPSRAFCSCRSCLCLLLYLCLACSLCSSFLTSLSRVLLRSCFFLLTCILVCALPLFLVLRCVVVVPLLLCTVVGDAALGSRCLLSQLCPFSQLPCDHLHDCAALCSLRARVKPLCDSMALPSYTN